MEASPEVVALRYPPEEFARVWPQLQRDMDLVPHVWAPWYTKEWIFHSVMCGSVQCWGAGFDGGVRLFLFTQIANYPAARVLQSILMLGNSFDECRDAICAAAEQFAREMECDRLEVMGRAGFEKKLSEFGYRKVGVVMSAPVNQTRTQ